MDVAAAARISEMLPNTASVVDIGGGACPFPRADSVVDAVAYDDRESLGTVDLGIPPRFTRETWVQVDLCERGRWPIEDKQFDFAVCSHLLEDVRDPIWVCSELSRIAKAGYIEVPSRITEQSLGVEHPRYAGYHHHRWLITNTDGRLAFRHKPHQLHVVNAAIVARVGIRREINPKHAITSLWWTEEIECAEVLEFSEERVVEELIQFASEARKIPDLAVARRASKLAQVKRAAYFARLRLGMR